MGQITVTLPDELESEVRKHVHQGNYTTISSLIVESLREKMNGEKGLSYWQRAQLTLSLENNRLLQSLLGTKSVLAETSWPKQQQYEALMEGYKIEYNSLFNPVSHRELSDADAQFVLEVMETYATMQFVSDQLRDNALREQTIFPGFDPENQSWLIEYARYLRKHGMHRDLRMQNKDITLTGHQPDYEQITKRFREIEERRLNDKNVPDYTSADISYMLFGGN
jgi:uncharacterized protein YfbU (UPF0304 family)